MRSLLIAMLIFICASCSTTKYVEVPVETVKTEYVTQHLRDSIFVHDSIDRYNKGDTVFLTKYKNIYRLVTKVDTVLKTDTIPKVITITKTEVKKVNEIKWWLNILMYSGIAFLTSLAIFAYKKVKSIIR